MRSQPLETHDTTGAPTDPIGEIPPHGATRRARRPDRIALIDPVGDAGIGGYTHELAEGLIDCGRAVTVYAPHEAFAASLRRRYSLSSLHDPGEAIPDRTGAGLRASSDTSSLEAYFDVLARRGTPGGRVGGAPCQQRLPLGTCTQSSSPRRTTQIASAPHAPRHHPEAWAAAIAADADLLWTQWPDAGALDHGVRAAARQLGGRWVHTIHNVHPHEPDPDAIARHAQTYRDATALVVHSRDAATQLVEAYPETRGKIIGSRVGLYTIYPRRPRARAAVRRRLEVDPHDVVVLIFGGVRPYKNIDAALAALDDPRCGRLVLVVAGWEWGYPDAGAGDRLRRTRRLVRETGLGGRVRLLPGPFGLSQTAELFEACDAVLLPYVSGSGSGVLLLALAFEKHVLATNAGGMHDYLCDYAASTLLPGSAPHDVAAGLADLERRLAQAGNSFDIPSYLRWPAIAGETVTRIESLFRRTVPTI